MEYIPAKRLVLRSKSAGWFGTDHTMNIYRGCCHGCLYCDSRSDCYHIDRFDTVRAKENALAIIRDDLRRKIRPGIIGTGAMSDPYNPFERELKLTRGALALIEAYGFGVAIATKSDLITRDIDILQSIAQNAPVLCKITLTTADDTLAAKLEPHAPSPSRRLEAVRALSQAGLKVCVLLMPVLPFLEDSEENILSVVEQSAAAGASYVYPALGMTLRQGQREYFYAALEAAFPGEYLSTRYEKQYGARYWCASPAAKRLYSVFSARCDALGLLTQMREITAHYQRGYGDRQLTFFE